MKIWMADFWIESSLILPSDQRELRVKLEDCEISFQNASQDARPSEALVGQIVLEAEDISTAEALSNTRIREVLDVLSFTTSCSFRVSRPHFLMDWTPGLEIREQYAYGRDDLEDRFPHFVSEHLKTLSELETFKGIQELRAPLRWYGAGIRARIAEDQFQYFWLVLEQIAEITKPSAQVTDKCQRCRTDLFCPSCNAVSAHRPFPKQAVEALLSKLNVSTERQRDLFDVRNGIVHGRARAEIQELIRSRQQPDFEIADAVDFIWRTAFMAILNALRVPKSKIDRLTFGAPYSIVSQTRTFKAYLHMGMKGDPTNPRLENVVVPQVDAIRVNERGEEINPRTGETIKTPDP
jgi:Methylamine utilization protein MauJ